VGKNYLIPAALFLYCTSVRYYFLKEKEKIGKFTGGIYEITGNMGEINCIW
jgi:hypothetical protein